jgi:flagellar motility protein MotE (MotC chaperone)
MQFVRDLRLIPIVVIAAAALFVLKTSAIVIEGGYTLVASRTAQAQGLGAPAGRVPAPALGPGSIETIPPDADSGTVAPPAAAEEWAAAARADRERNDNSHDWVRDLYSPAAAAGEVTGSVAAPRPEAAPAQSGAQGAPAKAYAEASEPPPQDLPKPLLSAGERAVLESLQQRRQELETRSREMEVRDSLLKAAEKRIEQRLQDVKDAETRISGASAKREEEDQAKFKSLVTMYENMKAKEAAKIFDRLELRVLVELANKMNPRRMSDILGVMTPEAAERLTIEIANRSGALGGGSAPAASDLPKIEGRPNKS